MNSFRNLTCGIKFSKQKVPKTFKKEKKKLNGVTSKESFENFEDVEIKSEPEDDYLYEATSNGHESSTSVDFSASDVEIKTEPEDSDENEAEQEFLVTSTSSEKTKKKKKRKTKELTGEQKKKAEEIKVNRLRKENNIKVVGTDVPAPVLTFQDLYDTYEISSIVKENMNQIGYEKPTPIQMQAIPVMLEGRQIRACAPTGSGKTTAFLLPVIQNIINDNKINPNDPKKIKALIICPTRELAAQILRECVRLCDDTGVRAHIIKNTDDDYLKNFHKKQTNILIVTPNRLCYILKKGFPNFSLASVQWIVIDEVDKLFEESKNDFQEELKTILDGCTHAERKFGVFSATTSSPIVRWVHETLIDFVTVKIGVTNTPISSVKQELMFVGSESGKLLAVRDIVRAGVSPPVLIFVQSKDRAQQLFTELIYDGLNIDLIHSDRSQKERDVVVRKFREGKIWFLICTELMSRGIDFKGVNVVINYDFPQSTISYIHRVGRSGRAGKSGKAITFFTSEDKKYLRDIAAIIKKSGGTVPDYMLSLKKSRKKDRVALMQKAPKRKAIRTLPQFEMSQRKRKKKYVNMSKAKKKKTEG